MDGSREVLDAATLAAGEEVAKVEILTRSGREYVVVAEEAKPTPLRQTLAEIVLEALARSDKPLKGSVLARRCGRTSADAYFRKVLALLVRSGKVERVRGGYKIAGDK